MRKFQNIILYNKWLFPEMLIPVSHPLIRNKISEQFCKNTHSNLDKTVASLIQMNPAIPERESFSLFSL
jgi:hypothetical protein